MVTTRSRNWLFSASRCRGHGRRGCAHGRHARLALAARPAAVPVPPRRWGPGIRRSSSLTSWSRCWSLTGSDPPSRAPSAIAATRPCVLVATAVEDDGLDAGGLGALGDELADLAGLGGLVTVERTQVGLEGRGRGDGVALACRRRPGRTRDGRTGDDEARTQRRCRRSSCEGGRDGDRERRVLPLARLIDHAMAYLPVFPTLRRTTLAGVAHTLALVGLGLADLADVGGDLADGLLVDALHGEACCCPRR